MFRRILASARGMRRRVALIAAGSAAVLGVLLISSALAVHDLAFQLDGDVRASTTAHPPQNPLPPNDWDSLFDNTGATKSTLPAGFTAAKFSKDFKTTTSGAFDTSDGSTYATGSKDTLPITPGWQCNFDSNVNSKIDIMNAYAAAYTDPTSQHQIVYFALERNSNAGDGNVGFWFLQDAVGCTSPKGNVAFTGDHRDGDLLIVSAFTNGGSVSTIDVYRWNGGANGSLGQTPVAHGVDCKSTAGGDAACATVNGATNGTNGLITTPWQTSNKVDGPGTKLQESEFFEGGLDLTASNLGGKCFNVFIGDTRSSQSLTATLFDYAQGVIGECTSTTSTTPVDAANTTQPPATSIPAAPADAKVLVKDKATVAVSGASSFSGTVSFHICGPTAANSSALCSTGGVDLGSVPITQNGSVTSPTATVTAAGRYCFRAEFSGDSSLGVPGSSDSSAAECFTVAPVQPALSTQATSGPVDFGQKISDTVSLSGTAKQPGSGGPTGSDGSINPATLGGNAKGTISVTAYGPDSCSTVALSAVTLNVDGNGNYGGAGSVTEFTPTAPGVYVFVASYSGDSPNTKNVAATACADQPNAEKVTVRQIPTQLKTKQSWYPNDTATVTSTVGNLASGGSVAFSLYDNASCTGTAKYTETKSIAGGSASQEVGTSNTTFKVTTAYDDPADSVAGPFYWKVVYTPASSDTAHLGTTSDCVENHTYTYTNDAGPSSG